MSGTWSKEDRYSFEKSEVMQELETKILDTVRRVDILKDKIAAQEAGVIGQEADDAANSVNALTDSLKKLEQVSSADDEGEASDIDEDSDEVAKDGLQDEILDDLRDLVAAALSEGNIKLAYRIERTIDEIMEQDILCL